MLIEREARAGIAAGTITVLFRQWRRPQVVAGRRYRTSAGILEMREVEVISAAQVTDHDAQAAGYNCAKDVLHGLPAEPDELPLYRLRFSRLPGPDPRDVLAQTATMSAAEVAGVRRRLGRMDRASTHGPWTRAVLHTIAERPGVRAADLAAGFGREVFAFKHDVRKLKALGLTLSLEVGYTLSPRGKVYLSRTPEQ